MRKNSVALFLFVLSFAFLFFDGLIITGNVVGFEAFSSLFFYAFLVSFISFLLVLVSRQGLDAIMIPTGGLEADKKRTQKAISHYYFPGTSFILISGKIDRDESGRVSKDAEPYQIYKQLREYGVRPSDVVVEGRSRKTIENVLYSMDKLKRRGAHDVGIASGDSHLDRFEDIIEQGKREGIVDRDFHMHRLTTSESAGEKFYGAITRLVNRYKLRSGLKNAGDVKVPKIIRKAGTLISGH